MVCWAKGTASAIFCLVFCFLFFVFSSRRCSSVPYPHHGCLYVIITTMAVGACSLRAVDFTMVGEHLARLQLASLLRTPHLCCSVRSSLLPVNFGGHAPCVHCIPIPVVPQYRSFLVYHTLFSFSRLWFQNFWNLRFLLLAQTAVSTCLYIPFGPPLCSFQCYPRRK